MSKPEEKLTNGDRRSFVKKATYIAPLVLTLPAMPSIAQSGSGGGGTPTCDPNKNDCIPIP